MFDSHKKGDKEYPEEPNQRRFHTVITGKKCAVTEGKNQRRSQTTGYPRLISSKCTLKHQEQKSGPDHPGKQKYGTIEIAHKTIDDGNGFETGKDGDQNKEQAGNQAMFFKTDERIQNMSTIKLSDGHQV